MNKKIVHSVFEHVAATFPNRNAIEESSGASITYRDLNYRANIIGALLAERGIGRDKLAAVLLPTGIAYTAAILGVMKAGGIFMPLDLALPRPRLHHILSHTTPAVIVTDEASAVELENMLAEFGLAECTKVLVIPHPHPNPPPKGERIKFTDLNFTAGEWVRSPANVTSDGSNLPLISEPDDSCYVIYTSGSTGVPKFIEGWHKGLAHYCHWQATEFELNETSKISQMAPVTFEASLKDFFVALTCGATLCIPSPDVKENPARLIEWIELSALTLFQTVPSYLRLVTREVAAQGDKNRFPALKLLFQSGDTLYGKDVNLWRQTTGEHVELVNLYGPAEVTLLKSFHRIPPGELKPNEIVPIGKPISNTVILILNGDTLCPPGKIGEICVKSPFIVKGYYRSPELTAEKFVQNPLNAETRDIIYRTGDLGRYRADMTIEFIGRMDSQVKVHGNRIELAEIENLLLSCPEISQVVVIPHRTDEMENVLACYYTEQEPVTHAWLRELILSSLPDYMVPAYFIRMESLPLSLNGKVDRKALPKPEDLVITSYEAPVTPTEKVLAEIWGEILGLARVGIGNVFIEIGGDSLKAIRVIARIYKRLGVEVSVRDFFSNPTIRELAQFVDASRTKNYQQITAVPEADSYELSHAQRRLWMIDQLEEDSSAYNMAACMLIEGEFNPDTFVRAVKAVHWRHETLRTTFSAIDGVPRQFIHKQLEPLVRVIDISTSYDPEQAARDYFQEEAAYSFDLATGPLYRITLMRLGDRRTVLSFVIHHIISDVWSLGVMTSELSIFYNDFVKSRTTELQPLTIHYRDFAVWHNAVLASDETNSDRAYWLEKLADPLPLLDFPTDHPRPAVKSYSGGTVRCLFGEDLTHKLSQLSEACGVSLFAMVVSLVRVLAYRYTGQEDLVIGSPIAGRIRPELETQIGFFINTLALRDQLRAEQSFTELLYQVMATNNTAFDHQNFPFDLLVDELKIQRDVSRSPVFDLMVVLQNIAEATFDFSGAIVKEFDRFESVSKFDLGFVFAPQGGEMEMLIEYNADIFDLITIQRLSENIVRLSEGVVDDPSCPIAKLPLLSDDELHQVLSVFNRKDDILPIPGIGSFIHQLFEEQASKTPDAVALIHKTTQITYGDLNTRANRLAHYLKGLGVVNDTLVAICMERSSAMIVALLGVLKSGAAYVPMDASYPNERLSFMLEDSGAKVLVTQENMCRNLPDVTEHTICFDSEEAAMSTLPEFNHDCSVSPEDLAYLIYTSGSTGKPKGVAIEHRSPAAFIKWANSVFTPDELTGVLAGTSICFDLSIFEMFVPLSVGGTVIISENVIELPSVEARNLVTLVNTVPSAIDALLRNNALPESVRVVNLAGEPLTTELADRVYDVPTVQKVYDLYGPSEDTTYSTVKLRLPGEPPSIGRPITLTQLYILDINNQPTPIGVPGELHLGGAGLARGYLNRPELTAEKFVPDPFSREPGARLYKTGDLARYRLDGNVEYLGRLDHQVKIRGFRIELGEIETALESHPAIQEAVVIARSEDVGEKRLVAYIVAMPGNLTDIKGTTDHHPTPTTGELLSFLKVSLPDFMLPAAFVFLQALPLTSNGKLDRKALPDPRSADVGTPDIGTVYAAPRNDVERIVAEVWAGVLGVEKVGIHDNYFALGGDSIRAIQVGSRLQQQGLKMEMRDIFQFPSVAVLAGRVNRLTRIASQEPVKGLIPLTPIQRWFFECHSDGVHHFNQTNLFRSRERLDSQALSTLLAALVDHHDALRISFNSAESAWVQENLPLGVEPRFEFVDLTADPDPLGTMERHAALVQSSFDLTKAPLFAAVLYRLESGDRLLLAAHHLIIDGVSWRILAEDVNTGYAALTAGRRLELPRKSDSFKLWSEALVRYSDSDKLLQELKYWTGIASRYISPLPLIMGNDCDMGKSSDFDEIILSLSESETSRFLTEANRAYSTEPADLLLTALAYSLNEWTGAECHLIALEGHGREDIGCGLDISRTVGWFTSLYPHLLELSERDDFGYRLKVVKEGLRAVPLHGVGYGVLRWLTDNCNKQHVELPKLPQICFNYFGSFDSDFGDGTFAPSEERHGDNVSSKLEASFALEYNCSIIGGIFSVYLRYDRRQIEFSTGKRLAEGFTKHLRDLIKHCCSQKETAITPSDISYDGLDIDQLDALLEGIDL